MLFLTIFVMLLVLYFGLVDPWVKRHKIKPHKGADAIFNIAGALVDLIRMKF
jgi:hypothetical protein